MREQYKKYDIEFANNDFLKRHPECLPFIGEKYDDSRLLLIGESHYIPKKAICYVNRSDFYDISYDDLEDGEYKGWINTRSVFENRVYNRVDFKNFFSNPATEIAKIINNTNSPSKEQRISAMHQYAFINYFKRPAYDRGKTIRGLTDNDYKYAYEITRYIISVLKPKLIIFLSRKAYYAFCDMRKQDDVLIPESMVKSVSHPSCCWWHRKRKDGKCAREDFSNYISAIFCEN